MASIDTQQKLMKHKLENFVKFLEKEVERKVNLNE